MARQALLVTLGFVLVSTRLLELVYGLMIVHCDSRTTSADEASCGRRFSSPGDSTVVASPGAGIFKIDRYGLANLLWFRHRVTDHVPWLVASSIAFRDCGLYDVWKTASFAALLILAGLCDSTRSVPTPPCVDGATMWQRF